MHRLKFDIYIGNKMVSGQANDVAAVIVPKFYIPKGNCKLDGSLLQNDSSYYFRNLYDVGTFIADWIELINDSNLITAVIFLNKLSLHRTFKGKDIIECIDKVNNFPNRVEIQSFNELV